MIRILVSFLFVVVLIGCSGAKNQYKIEKNTTISFMDAYYQDWVSGIRGGGSGSSIFLSQNISNYEESKLKGIYFRQRYSTLKFQGGSKYQGFIKGKSNWEDGDDIFVGENREKEKKKLKEEKDFPFDLKFNEAVISFLRQGKLRYIKIQLVKKEAETLPQ